MNIRGSFVTDDGTELKKETINNALLAQLCLIPLEQMVC